jgi:hypothetical protein
VIEASVVVDESLGAKTSRKAELTELVVPLKLGLDTQPMRRTSRASRRRLVYVAAALTIFGAAALAVVLATSAELPKAVSSRHAPIVVPATPASPVAVAPKAEIVGEAVASGSPVAPAEITDEAPAAAPAPAIEAQVAQPKPARMTPAASKPDVRKAIAHPTKKAAKPKYDPDALFFKGH